MLLVVGHPANDGDNAVVCGPIGAQPAVVQDLDLFQVERLADVALSEPNHHAAIRCLLANIPELDRALPGIRNVGLLATHALVRLDTEQLDWVEIVNKAQRAIGYRGTDLVVALGFDVTELAAGVSLLQKGREPRAVAIFCEGNESFDTPSHRLNGVAPVALALAHAQSHDIPWVLLTRASEIRLYTARADVGVGGRGRTDTYLEANLALLAESSEGYLHLLFSSDALADEGHIRKLLRDSERFASELAIALRERVYGVAVPALAQAIGAKLDARPTEAELADAYQQILLILFRLLFTAYAEDRDLLPYRTNGAYAEHSLTALAVERAQKWKNDQKAHEESGGYALWERVAAIWRAVDVGHEEWGIPAYNGGLFSQDPQLSPYGAALTAVKVQDSEFAPALDAVLLNDSAEGIGPIDFRSLSVRDFGTIYEGLLESRLSVAPKNLTLKAADGKQQYAPVGRGEEIKVHKGEVYLHHHRGFRKSTGSYFTKPFAVEHLLDSALEPSLDRHISRLESLRKAGDDAKLYRSFFDFRCADIAMGSAHFLVAAVDRIEARLSAYLALHPVPEIVAELNRLREAAYIAVDDASQNLQIETAQLLRRQVARHCIYGVDLQPVAVELARVSIWIHTFIPGLPLSFLDHNLVCGDSLSGVSSLSDALAATRRKGGETSPDLFRNRMQEHFDNAIPALSKLASTSDSTLLEVGEARAAHRAAKEATVIPRSLFDLVSASRAKAIDLPEMIDRGEVLDDETIKCAHARLEVQSAIIQFRPVHYPSAFPEVFVRTNPGFDCLLGNPPWGIIQADNKIWWGQHLPGVRGLSIGEMNSTLHALRVERPDLRAEFTNARASADRYRKLLRASFPRLGSRKTDLYKAFSWQNWNLVRDEGFIGIVLPRTALQSDGSQPWREDTLANGTFVDLTTLANNAGWVFDDVHYSYTVALVTLRRRLPLDLPLSLCGPICNQYVYDQERQQRSTKVAVSDIYQWSNDCTIPQLPGGVEAVRLFRQMRSHPRFDGESLLAGAPGTHASNAQWAFQPVQETNSSTDQSRFVLDKGESGAQCHLAIPAEHVTHGPMRVMGDESSVPATWCVYGGKSFNLWEPATGDYYASAGAELMIKYLQEKRLKQHKLTSSAFSKQSGADVENVNTLPCLFPRIAFRDVARNSDKRTMIASLVPPHVVLTEKAPYLLRLRGDARHEAYLLGLLSSMILDWYMRRVVEASVALYLVKNLPIPHVNVYENIHARRVVNIAGRLAAVDDRYSNWAREVGVPVGSVVDSSIRQSLVHELDACVAHLYGLDEEDLEVLYATFDEKSPHRYRDRHSAVLRHFRKR